MNLENLTIRKAYKQDCEEMIQLIKELAVYEKAGDQVEVTAEQLKMDGFSASPKFHVIVAEYEQEIIGISFYYFKYSTWKGECLYLEDLVVKQSQRRKGIGKLLFEETIKEAHRAKVKRMEWQVLDWNEPAINFYKKYPTELDEEWINCRFYEKNLDLLTKK